MASIGILAGVVALAGGVGRAQDPPAMVQALTAEMETQVLTSDGPSAPPMTAKLWVLDAAARIDPEFGADRAGYAEYHLYDFARSRFYRVFPDDRIYFDQALSLPLALRAFIEGWAPPPREVTERDIPLKKDVVDGLPARLVLAERRIGPSRRPAYAFVWRAVDAARLPLRVIYTQDTARTVMVSYRRVATESLEAARFAVPEGFSNLNPF